MANTITFLKQIVGRKFSEVGIAYEVENHLNYKLVPMDNDEIGAQVRRALLLFLPERPYEHSKI